MQRITTTIGIPLAAAAFAAVGALGFPGTASAAVSAGAGATPPAAVTPAPEDWGQHWGDPADWDHPEWGPGWNHGHPARDWIPPRDWMPPRDWVPPDGWAPPVGWAPRGDWVGPCSGPLHDLLRPARCL